MSDEADAPRVLILGSAGSGKTTLLKAIVDGAVPSRPPAKSVGAHIEVIHIQTDTREQDAELEENGSESLSHLESLALIEPDVSLEYRHARHLYYDLVDGIIVVYEAGRHSSWRAGLDLLTEFVSHHVKRKVQWRANEQAPAPSKLSHGAKLPALEDLVSAAAREVALWLADMPVLFLATKCDVPVGIAGHGPGSLMDSIAAAVAAVCCCQWRGSTPRPRVAPNPALRPGTTTRIKVEVPLVLQPGTVIEGATTKNTAEVCADACGAACCGRCRGQAPPTRGPRYARLDVTVAGCSCTPGPRDRDKSAPPWVVGSDAFGPPVGLVAPMDVLSSFFVGVLDRRRRGCEGRASV